MDTRNSRRTRRLVIILSILVHILILFALFYATYQPSHTAALPTHRKDDGEIIQILSQSKSNPGAQVIFDERPHPTQPDAVKYAQDERKEEFAEPLDMPEHKTPDVTFLTEKEKPPTPPQVQKKNTITLAQLTQGFLKSMQHDEDGATHQKFDQKKMAQQVYGNKVYTQIKRAINADKLAINLEEDLHTKVLFVITIDKHGNILRAFLDHPKKTRSLLAIERSIAHSAHNTGLFPPIPKSLGLETKTFKYPMVIDSKRGTHTYSLMYK